jgi:hypothetical protein
MINQKNIKIYTASLTPFQKELKKLFLKILEDYCNRFKVEIKDGRYKVSICTVEYQNHTVMSEMGLTAYGEDNNILVQVRDPYMEGMESSPYVDLKFLEILCHELVHVCQFMTGRKGIKIKGKLDKSDEEEYFFDPQEIEARVLESFYTSRFAAKLFLKQKPEVPDDGDNIRH